MVQIQQEPVPVLAKPFTSMVDGHNLYSCTHIQVQWPALVNVSLPGMFIQQYNTSLEQLGCRFTLAAGETYTSCIFEQICFSISVFVIYNA